MQELLAILKEVDYMFMQAKQRPYSDLSEALLDIGISWNKPDVYFANIETDAYNRLYHLGYVPFERERP
jgi:hypothetical protein